MTCNSVETEAVQPADSMHFCVQSDPLPSAVLADTPPSLPGAAFECGRTFPLLPREAPGGRHRVLLATITSLYAVRSTQIPPVTRGLSPLTSIFHLPGSRPPLCASPFGSVGFLAEVSARRSVSAGLAPALGSQPSHAKGGGKSVWQVPPPVGAGLR